MFKYIYSIFSIVLVLGFSQFFTSEVFAEPPLVDAMGPYVPVVGGTVEVSAQGSDPENGELTYAWDLDNNGSFETLGQTVIFSADGFGTGNQHVITVQATDTEGLTAMDTALVYITEATSVSEVHVISGHSVTVTLHDPNGERFGDHSDGSPLSQYWGIELLVDYDRDISTENATYYDSPSFPISDDTITYTFDVADSAQFLTNIVLVTYLNAQELTVYPLDGESGNLYNPLICLEKAPSTFCWNYAIHFFSDNTNPTADAHGPYEVIVGESVQVSATGTDPEDGELTYAWDLDNNGSFETSGQSVSFDSIGLSAGEYTISVQVTDDGGLTATDQATVNVITAQEAGEDIINNVEELVNSGDLSSGQGNALVSKLQNIIEKINQGQINAAINQLQAFIAQVNDYISTGVLTSEEGQPLIDAANQIVSVLQS
jgi:hypothetical protein